MLLYGAVAVSDPAVVPHGEGASSGDGSIPATLSALNATLQDAVSRLNREIELVASSVSHEGGQGWTCRDAGGRRHSAFGPPAPPVGASGPAVVPHPSYQPTYGPSTEEARRLAQ